MSANSSFDPIEAPEKRMGSAADVAEVLRNSDNILIVSHVRPDGDCLGSATALSMALEQLGKRVISYNPSPTPERLMFLPSIESVRQQLPDWEVELTVFVDCGGPGRVTPDFKPLGKSCINIDHHATNEVFADLNYIDIKATAVGEQIYYIVQELGAEMTPEIATSIYTSIVADTGSFKYPNTNQRTFEVAAELANAGVNPSFVCRNLYETRPREEIVLTAKVLNRLNYETEGRLIWSQLMWADYAEVGGDDFEPEGLVSEIRAINGVEVSVLFHELENGGLRAGFRGKGDVDCAAIAQQFGGGGHFNAAGCFMDGVDFEKAKADIIKASIAEIERVFDGKS
ncbi:bifunctional oligoribonuclease/PAP phosphatase NrnA [bacterium]|nr:bifunctional oligoribonuclease/PAP phosphatase NrnA [bacterium]